MEELYLGVGSWTSLSDCRIEFRVGDNFPTNTVDSGSKGIILMVYSIFLDVWQHNKIIGLFSSPFKNENLMLFSGRSSKPSQVSSI